MTQQISLCFINKKYPTKLIFYKVKATADMFNLKKRMIKFFGTAIQPTITDFKLVTKGPPEDDQNDTIPDNFFEEKYNEYDAFNIMEQIKKLNMYPLTSLKEPQIYFRTVQLEIEVKVIGNQKESNFKFPLAYEDNSYNKLLSNIENKMGKINPYRTFQNNSKRDNINTELDMKKYYQQGLVMFLFPIQARFINKTNEEETKIFLKFDKPLIDYFNDSLSKKLKITSSNLLLKIQNKTEAIRFDEPIHQILKKQDKEPVIFEIYDQTPNKIPLLIPLGSHEIKFDFEYGTENILIRDLIEMIVKYFDISDKIENIKLLDNNKEVDRRDRAKKYSSQNIVLTLICDESINWQMKRKFDIKGKKELKTIPIDKTIKSIIQEIADEYETDKSLISIKLENSNLIPSMYFGQFFIPAEKIVKAEISDFTEFVNLKPIGLEKAPKNQIKIGFTPKMKIQTLRNSQKFQKMVPTEQQKEVNFYLREDKLDETKSFSDYGIENDYVIEVKFGKVFILKYNDKDYNIYGAKSYSDLEKYIKKNLDITSEKFLIEQDGKILLDTASISKCQNGTIFKVRTVVKMKFEIDNVKIEADSNEKVLYIINTYAEKKKISADSIGLIDEDEETLNRDAYLFSEFKEEKSIYKLKSKKASKYTFQTQEGKFFNESFLPSTKISDVLEELKSKKKKITDKSIIIYMGRIANKNSTLSDLMGGKDDVEDAEPIIIEDEVPEQIKVELKFKIDPKSKKGSDQNLREQFIFVKPCEVLNIHFFASIICQQEYDAITLEKDDELLNDDDILEENAKIIVDLTPITQNKKTKAKDIQNILSETQKNLNLYKTQVLVQSSESETESEESELESFEEDEFDDPFKKGNGTYRPSEDDPDNEYIFKFKVIGGEDFELQFPNDVTVSDVKEKIAEREGTDSENITIFVGNQRLADFNKLTNLTIPKKVSYFSVKIIDLQNTLICTRVRLKS